MKKNSNVEILIREKVEDIHLQMDYALLNEIGSKDTKDMYVF